MYLLVLKCGKRSIKIQYNVFNNLFLIYLIHYQD